MLLLLFIVKVSWNSVMNFSNFWASVVFRFGLVPNTTFWSFLRRSGVSFTVGIVGHQLVLPS
jgi:hypothetical protein